MPRLVSSDAPPECLFFSEPEIPGSFLLPACSAEEKAWTTLSHGNSTPELLMASSQVPLI